MDDFVDKGRKRYFDGLTTVEQYLKEIQEYELLTEQEEKELALKILDGDILAKEKFISSNLRLVVNIARDYMNIGLDFSDLIQEGNIGLIDAIDRYDVSKGFRFSTYATYWIKKRMLRALAYKGRNISLTSNFYYNLLVLTRTRDELTRLFNKIPTVEELASEMNWTVQKVSQLLQYEHDSCSLNECTGIDKDEELITRIPTDDDLDEYVEKRILMDKVEQLLIDADLTEKEMEVIKKRFGFDDYDASTLDGIGKDFGLTRERIRQIERIALAKIYKSKNIDELTNYMDDPDKAKEKVKELRKSFYEH